MYGSSSASVRAMDSREHDEGVFIRCLRMFYVSEALMLSAIVANVGRSEWGTTANQWRVMHHSAFGKNYLGNSPPPVIHSHALSTYSHIPKRTQGIYTYHRHNRIFSVRRRLNRQSGVQHGRIRPQRTVHAVHATDDQASEAAIRAAYGRRIASFIVQRRLFIACRTSIQPDYTKSTACATSCRPHPT